MNTLKLAQTIAIAEGISYLLFAVTMPLKYLYEITSPNMVVGMVHGFLFIAYLGVMLWVDMDKKWTMKDKAIIYGASLFPFATFYVERRYLRA